MRILVAMSGGVDSAVAAARLVAEGHDVTGVHLALSKNRESYRSGARGCCSLEDSHDARRVADKLQIPFYVWDLAQQFHEDVVEDFISQYRQGYTPNPCLRCNEKIKFEAVLERGIALGFDKVATGHYARLVEHDSVVSLWRGDDKAKDQSYVLAGLNQHQISHCLFPLHDVVKRDVRAEAAELGLGVAKKPDSHDICFIPDGDTAGFLHSNIGRLDGEFVDESGRIVGRHDGFHQFTIGQRRGLHLSNPAGDGRPRYVLKIEPVNNQVVVGPKESLQVDELIASFATFVESPVYGPWQGMAQIRAHHEPVKATISYDGSQTRVLLETPVVGVAPGQAVALYDGDRVVGAATITATAKAQS